MRVALKLVWPMMVTACSLQLLWAHDLSPRAYVNTSLHSNAISLTCSCDSGSLLFAGTAPTNDTTGMAQLFGNAVHTAGASP
jgi:hypothetical protein